MGLTSVTALATTVSWCHQFLDFSTDTMLNSPLPTVTTHLKCRLLFLGFAEFPSTQECRSWLGIGRKATGLKQLTQAHEGPGHLWSFRVGCIFFLKTIYYWGEKSVSWWWLHPEQSETPGTVGTDIFGLVEVTSSCVSVCGQFHAAFSFSRLLNLQFL